MKTLMAFMKKDFLEQLRTKKLMILCIIFAFIGILNPVTAKMTPWLIDILSDTLEQSGLGGMEITAISVSALESWTEFFANVPMALIALVIMESGIITRECTSGTLVLSLTKGLERYKVMISKTTVLMTLWTVCYLVCFGVTYVGTEIFWDNSIVPDLAFASFCNWLFGAWICAFIIFFSSFLRSSALAILCTGGIVIVSSFLGALPKIDKFMPTFLSNGAYIVYGYRPLSTYIPSLIIASVFIAACIVLSIPLFNKKQI